MSNHYDVLQVQRTAESAVIEKAYRALCLKNHPDTVPEHRREAATRRMQRINEAYTVLSDPKARRRYDSTLPRESHEDAWDRFMEVGLVGLFMDRFGPLER